MKFEPLFINSMDPPKVAGFVKYGSGLSVLKRGDTSVQ
jgi:hypothetical protein